LETTARRARLVVADRLGQQDLSNHLREHGRERGAGQGLVLPRKQFEPHKTRNGWGTAASPIVAQGRVYIVDDNEDASFVVALDAATGNKVWRETRDEKTNWATPYLWQNDLRTELVTAGTNKIRSYDLDGKLLWELGGMSSIAIPTPFSGFGLLYVSSGYVMDKKKPIYAVRPGAGGDISLTEAAPSNPHIAWHVADGGPYNTSPLLYGDYLYVLLDRGMLSCYDAHTGEAKYEKQRLPNGRAFTASPWAYRGKIFAISEFGSTFVVEAGPEFKVLYNNDLAGEPMCMSTPAMAGDRLLLRTATELYCLREGAVLSEPAAPSEAQ
jgi:outer membrane protein assembly factor BamB